MLGNAARFRRSSNATGWVSPTGHNDASGNWEYPLNAYDDELGSYARHYHDVQDPDGQWSSYLYLTHASMTADGIRFYARDDDEIDSVDVDVYRDGVWTDVYEGAFNNLQWEEHSFAEGTVTEARIRFHVYRNKGIVNGAPAFEPVLERTLPRKGFETGLVVKGAQIDIADLDNDGRQDIIVAAVYKTQDGKAQPLVLRNRGGMQFDVPPLERCMGYYASGPVADYDRDGRLDIFLPRWSDALKNRLFRTEKVAVTRSR